MAVRRMLIVDRYRLREPVGTGGMGRVWLARDEMLDRDVAVKEFVPADWMTDVEKDRLRTRTLREARSAARLNHPNVVRVYDVVHAEDLPWIVMEYVPSRSLHHVIGTDGTLAPEAVARIGLEVLKALTAAHQAGVLHRDIKPHNVLIGDDGRVVLTDFGLATFLGDGSVTGPGLIFGSPQYVSPERARDGASTVESDLWSLGATLYAAVEGRTPYSRETAMGTLMALATEAPDPPVLAGPLAPVLNGLLRREPADRLTADEVADGLRVVLAAAVPAAAVPADQRPALPAPRRPVDEAAPDAGAATPAAPWRPEPVRPGRRYRARLAVAGGAAVAVLVVAGAGYAAWRRPHGNDDTRILPAAGADTGGHGAGGFSPTVCGAPTGAALPRTPQPGAARGVNGWQLLNGYSYFTVASAFHIAVPDGWTYEKVGTTFCFRDPGGVRFLSVDPDRNPSGDPIKACQNEASRLVAAGELPGYRQLGIDNVPLLSKAADWQYTYQGPDGLPMHAMTRWFTTDGRAFALGWATREFDWQVNLSAYAMLKSTFYVTRPFGKRGTPKAPVTG